MAFVTVVKGLIEQGCTFTLQTVAIKRHVSDCVQYQSCALAAVINTEARAPCSCIAGHALQKDHIGLQHCYQLILQMDRFLHCAYMDPRTVQQVKDICGQQDCHHPRRHVLCNLKTCAISV